MSLDEFFTRIRRYDQNAAVIFDRDEPVGRPTDLVLPWRRWWGRRKSKKNALGLNSAAKDS
jgi:hypothetical protein